ncbi:hypothetical protein SDC9_49244 [bioreactor metagenome]|uniref:Signal transduction histidine kinase dimerisation/phosphoacceptor domain-containing protein n=1 Tax=bioreactor metagenome TaxID=1076179 RepID=A0A644WGH5_9ZZZZ
MIKLIHFLLLQIVLIASFGQSDQNISAGPAIPFEDEAYYFWGINSDSTLHYTSLMREAAKEFAAGSCMQLITDGYSYLYEDNYDSADVFFAAALDADSLPALWKAYLLTGTGQSAIFNGDINDGIIQVFEARELFANLGDEKEQSQCELVIALACFDMGRYQESLSLLMKLLPWFARHNDYDNVIMCLTGIGRVYAEQNKTVFALQSYLKALELCTTKKVHMTPSISLNNIGMIYFISNQADSALMYFTAAIETDEKEGNFPLLPGRYNNIGNALLKLGKAGKAEEYYRKALNVLEKYPDPYAECQIINNMADAKMAKHEYDEAEKLYLSSLATARKLQLKPLIYYNCESLAKLYDQKNEPIKELRYLKEYYVLRDSLNNEEHLQTLDELEVKYKSESQKHVIDKLEQQNELKNTRIQRDKNLRWIYFLLIFFLSVLILFFYYFLRIRQRLNKALMTENRNLNEVNEFKDRFFNLISHEFRTPLSLIIWSCTGNTGRCSSES